MRHRISSFRKKDQYQSIRKENPLNNPLKQINVCPLKNKTQRKKPFVNN
jgi:hypothetical protein